MHRVRCHEDVDQLFTGYADKKDVCDCVCVWVFVYNLRPFMWGCVDTLRCTLPIQNVSMKSLNFGAHVGCKLLAGTLGKTSAYQSKG